MTELRAMANADYWEYRTDRSYDDQRGGGLLHPNGTQIVAFDRAFLAAATRHVLDLHDIDAGSCPAGGDHTFRVHDESPAGPRRVVHCTECDATPSTIDQEAASA